MKRRVNRSTVRTPMCARYQSPGQATTERYWQLTEPLWNFEASWRVLPTQQIPTVLALNGVSTGRMMRWGLIPYSGESAYPLINATVEKLTTWHGWRYPWQHGRRRILPMSGFYEPHVFPGGRKEPFYVRVRDRPISASQAFGSVSGVRAARTRCHAL